jgi:hypothetical protein
MMVTRVLPVSCHTFYYVIDVLLSSKNGETPHPYIPLYCGIL